MSVTAFVLARGDELIRHTLEHLMLTGISTALAMGIGVPLGVVAFKIKPIQGPLLMAIGVLQTIPSLALLAMLLALFGKIGVLPALVALVLYALLPIVRNTVTGLGAVGPDIEEAALGMGMTATQELGLVRLPMATPVILAGIRTAAVIGVGVATLAAFIGAGGLGQFIMQGLYSSDTRLILLGAIPAALLAILVDGTLALMGWGFRAKRLRKPWVRWVRPIALSAPLVLLLLAMGGYSRLAQPGADTIRIGGKAFTEQTILGEMLAQVIEHETPLKVDRRFNLSGTMICHEALVRGEIDTYPEYTGTALVAILKQPVINDAKLAYGVVSDAYAKRFDAVWLLPLGYNNTYVMTVRDSMAQRYGWEKVSDLTAQASRLKAGFHPEFDERPDGYRRFVDIYGFRFGQTRDMDSAILYGALAKGEVDVISGYSTDGRIPAYHLKMLADDRHFFPPYDAAFVMRNATLKAHPELRNVANRLAGQIDEAAMQQLSYEVDEQHQPIPQVAHRFLLAHKLLSD